jgi:hypothetical protein
MSFEINRDGFDHIHQEHHQMTGNIAHHAAESLISPFPLAGTMPKRMPVPWDPAHLFKNLRFRSAQTDGSGLRLGTNPIA